MRIAVWHDLPSGGGNRSMFDQVRGLVGRGHHVEIWYPPTANRGFLPLGEYVQEHVLPKDLDASTRRFSWTRKLGSFRDVLVGLDALDRHCRACSEEINRGGFDILFSHAGQYFHTSPIGRHVDLPSALYLGEPSRPLYEALPKLPWTAYPRRNGEGRLGYWKGYLRDQIKVQGWRIKVREEVASAEDFDQILVNSLFSRESVLRAYGLDSKVCYLGIDTRSFQPTGAPKEGFVVGLGNIDLNKGLNVALDALATIEPSSRPTLVWVGNYANESYLNKILEQAARLGVRFEHKVNVPHQELIDTLSRASAMLYTSRLEPFGYAPLEANACGTAVVAVAEGGVRETVVDGLNGRLIADGEPQSLGQAILEYCSDPEKARAVGQAARRNVEEKWTLEAALDRLESQLNRVLSKARTTTSPLP